MARLTLILFSMISTALMGSFIVAALTMGYVTLTPDPDRGAAWALCWPCRSAGMSPREILARG